jgi:hypothetical protein
LEGYLRSNYAYSLTLRETPDGKDPLAMFLFDARAGHCEYFASALTVMLRQIGIPARLINGFRAGEYNSIGNNWTVRQYHAHSWVESYFPPYGWIEFDSTPIDPAYPRTGFGQRLSDLRDAIGLWWWEGIVNYDSPKQYGVLTALFSAADRILNGIGNIWTSAQERWRSILARIHSPSRAPGFGRRWVFLMLGLLVASFLLIRSVRIRISRNARRLLYRNNARAVASSFYIEALHLLRSHGIKRSRELTPMEFAQSLSNHPASLSFLALTHMYYEARFGYPNRPFPHEEAQSLFRLLQDSLRHGK